jgi:hypothetical protein
LGCFLKTFDPKTFVNMDNGHTGSYIQIVWLINWAAF